MTFSSRFIALFAAMWFLPFNAMAWSISGSVICDRNADGHGGADDAPLSGVIVEIRSQSGSFVAYEMTDTNGNYVAVLPDVEDVYVVSLDAATLPGDATFVFPASTQYIVELTDTASSAQRNFLIDSVECRAQDPQVCWMTGGGVKFESLIGDQMAQRGPKDSLGGNVFPSCSSEPGNGGQWNHISHSLQLHFLGTDINTVRCGNVPGIEPGSESPVTPYNFIEFEGIGVLSGIKGNKFPKTPVSFFARVEDRNEPGSNGAKDGEDIDRYYIHVYEGNGVGTTHVLVDGDGDPGSIDPIPITGGNLQLHISSCDDPPSF